MPASPRLRRLVQVAVLLTVLASGILALRHLEWQRVRETFAAADPRLSAAAWLMFVLHMLLRAERWRRLLPEGHQPPRRPVFHAFVVSTGTGMILPPGGGEALRVYLMRERHGVPLAPMIGALGLEKLFEGIGLLFLVAPLPFVLALPRLVAWTTVGLVMGGLAVTAVLVLLARSTTKRHRLFQSRIWLRLEPGLHALRDRRTFVSCVTLSFAGQLCSGIGLTLLLWSLGLQPPWPTAALLMLGMSFVLVIPLVPGHVGTLEAAVVGALSLVGVPLAPALAYAVLAHALQISLVLLSLTGLGLLGGADERRAQAALVEQIR